MKAESDAFDFAKGARVRVRVKRDGRQVAKMDCSVAGFRHRPKHIADQVALSPPWSDRHTDHITMTPYDADFEVLSD